MSISGSIKRRFDRAIGTRQVTFEDSFETSRRDEAIPQGHIETRSQRLCLFHPQRDKDPGM